LADNLYLTKTNVLGEQGLVVVSHRVMSESYPENARISVRKAKQMGYKYVEIDVQKSTDGVFYCFHDEQLAALVLNADGSYNYDNPMTYAMAQLKDLYLFPRNKQSTTDSFRKTYGMSERIPTLEEMLTEIKKQDMGAWIDIKEYQPYTDAEIQTLLEIVRKSGLHDKAVICNVEETFLDRVRAFDKNIWISYYGDGEQTSEVWSAQPVINVFNNYKWERAVTVQYAVKMDTKEKVQALTNAGIITGVFFDFQESSVKKYEQYKEWGCSILYTDEIAGGVLDV
jgi:glycerophosphoryl diester phosphodiesterase